MSTLMCVRLNDACLLAPPQTTWSASACREASLKKLLQHAERRVGSQLKDTEIKIVEVQKVTNSMVSFLLWVL